MRTSSSQQMSGAGINGGDLLVVDRSIKPLPGHLVMVLGEEGHMVCRYSRNGKTRFQKEILSTVEIVPVTERIIEVVGVIKRTVGVKA